MKNKGLYITEFFIAAAACLFLLGTAGFAQGKITVRIPAETSVEADQVRIGEIAAVSGGDPASAERLGSISLGFSPRAGMLREIPKANILLALAAAGFSEGSLTLDIPAKVLVRRAAQTIGGDVLRQAVEKAVLAPLTGENITAKITKLELPERVELPFGVVEVKVINYQGVTRFNEPVTLSLEIRVDDTVLRRLPATVTVECMADTLVLTREVPPGTRLTPADVQVKTVRLEKQAAAYIRDPENLTGKKSLRNLAAGTPLTTDAVTADTVIKLGDTVSIVAQSGKLKFSVNGEARASGRIGDRIAVKNIQSGAIVQAVVVDESTVRLNF